MIELKANGRIYKPFSEIDINLSLNTVASTFSFTGFREIDNPDFDAIFKPLNYSPCEIWLVDESLNIRSKLITGTILNQGLSIQRKPELTNINGYSKTGILEDVSIPIELYPLERNNIGLSEIAQEICNFYGITLNISEDARSDASKIFEKIKASPSDSPKDFLSSIARQRNITLSHDVRGRLLLYKISSQSPAIVRIDESDQSLRIESRSNGQGVHSKVTVIRQSSTTDPNAGQTTLQSPFVNSEINRPIVRTLRHGENADTEKAANAILSSEARNFPVNISLQSWTIQGNLIFPGDLIEINAPSIFWNNTKVIAENVNYKGTTKNKTMSITAVLPCVYTGILPSSSPFN